MDDFCFDDDVFTDSIERKAIPLITDYKAKEEYDGWFHNLGDPRKLMLEKLGPVQFKHAIEHDYVYRRYQQALEKALLFIEIAESEDDCKVTNTREMVEMAIHCAARLERWNQVEQLLDRKQTTYEIGSLLVKGRFYPYCGRSAEAISALIEYSKQRKRDYHAWSLMANAFMMDAMKGGSEMAMHLAHLTMSRSLSIMASFCWSVTIPKVKERYEGEMNKLDDQLATIYSKRGYTQHFLSWMKDAKEKDRCAVGLDEYAWQDLLWIYEDWLNHLNDNGPIIDDQEKGVELL